MHVRIWDLGGKPWQGFECLGGQAAGKYFKVGVCTPANSCYGDFWAGPWFRPGTSVCTSIPIGVLVPVDSVPCCSESSMQKVSGAQITLTQIGAIFCPGGLV